MTDSTPSWVTPPETGPARPPAERRPRSLVLLAAAAVTTGLAAGQAVHVARRDELVVGLRVFLVAVVAFQALLAAGAVRRSAGSALGLLVCHLTTTLASVAGGFGDQRLLFTGGSVLGLVLVAASLGAFPSPTLPPIDPPIETGSPS